MAWACSACSFLNDEENAKCCKICNTKRKLSNGGDFKAAISLHVGQEQLKSVQSKITGLFGAVIENEDGDNRPRKKQKRETNSTKTQTTLNVAKETGSGFISCSFQTEKNYNRLKENAREFLPVFGVKKLRYVQPAAIKTALKQKSQIVVMATGGGKSLCFQLPAVAMGGVTVVISPLIALMIDQVKSLQSKGIQAAVISSGNTAAENRNVFAQLLAGKESVNRLVLVYCTPEQLKTERFRDALSKLHRSKRLSMLAVDESHCVSSWGHDFRPAFRKLTWFRENFPDVPCLACTATATEKVIEDIKEVLRLKDSPCQLSTFNRPNIFYKVRYKDVMDELKPGGSIGDLTKFITSQHSAAGSKECSGIVYVHKRHETQSLARIIEQSTGISTVAYHGGMKDQERKRLQELWASGKAAIAVATVAFGMGIDLGHVRYVIHWTLSKTIEAFYQESGRAGRDGLPSVSLLYFSKDDVGRFRYLLQQKKKHEADMESLKKMVEYATNKSCKRSHLLHHFGDSTPVNASEKDCCDFCSNPSRIGRLIDAAVAPPLSTKRSQVPFEPEKDLSLAPRPSKLTVGSLSINHDDKAFDEVDECPDKDPFAILAKYEVCLEWQLCSYL